MTYEEAIETLQHERDWSQQLSYVNKALDIAKEAMGKQIPKKPKQDDCAENIYYCPTCTRWFNGYHKPHHCKCGQALDWSEENETE